MQGTPKKILIVDDDKTIQSILKMVLQKAGFVVITALDAMQGLMMARQLKPDLIILDIMMPAGGGFHVFEKLQVMADFMNKPFIIYSAADKDEVQSKIPEGQFVKFFSKSASPEAILSAVQEMTGSGS